MRVTLIQEERTEVEHMESGLKTWAMKLLFKKTEKGEDPEFLPMVINELVDGDDLNIIKRAKKAARQFFVDRKFN